MVPAGTVLYTVGRMSSVHEIDERLAAEESSPLSDEERKFADAALNSLSAEQRTKITELDLITTVRWVGRHFIVLIFV